MTVKSAVISAIAVACILAAVFSLFADFNSYDYRSKTVDCDKSGIIFSITTFDGENESSPFVKCLGHAWLSIDNRSGHPIYIKDYEIENGKAVTFSVWAISGIEGLVFNLEPHYISKYGRYAGRRSLSTNIDESKLKAIEGYIDRNNKWTPGNNCSRWSLELWNEVAGDRLKLKTQTLLYTPKRVSKSFYEFDQIETDRDFSAAKGIFCYRDGVRTELKLCS